MFDHSARLSMYVQLPPKVAKFGSVQTFWSQRTRRGVLVGANDTLKYTIGWLRHGVFLLTMRGDVAF